MPRLTEADITALLLAVAILVAVARLLGEVARRFRQPPVIGELLAGVFLGPTILGRLWPEAQAWLFPREGSLPIALQGLTVLAITLFLLVAGMEVDFSTVWRRKRAAFSIGLGGTLVPFALGLLAGWQLPVTLGAAPDCRPLAFALFIAVAMAISALPVIARILMDLDLFRSDVGLTIIAVAVIDDLLGWIVFALVLTMVGRGAGSDLQAWETALLVLAFAGLMLTAGRWLFDAILPWIQAHASWPGGVLGVAASGALACAAFTEWLGVHAIFGAFIFGVALGDSRHLQARTRSAIEQFVAFVFAPIFFASVGLRIDFIEHFDLSLVALVLALATLGKLLGCVISARLARFSRREAWAVGFGLNARGAMEIVLGLLALNAGLITERLFVALFIMAIVTSVSAGTLIQVALGRPRPIRFTDFAASRLFSTNIQGDRAAVITALARHAAQDVSLDPDSIVRAALERENQMSSAIGHGLAIPQARQPGLKKPVVVVGVNPHGLDFDTPDGQPVFVIVLLLTPLEDPRTQLELLASVARVFRKPETVRLASQAASWTQFLAIANSAPDA